MRLNRFLTSGTISLKHYLRAFYTLLPLSCFFKDNPVWVDPFYFAIILKMEWYGFSFFVERFSFSFLTRFGNGFGIPDILSQEDFRTLQSDANNPE